MTQKEQNQIMTHHTHHDVDNRGIDETWLWVGGMESGVHVRVNPWDLVENAINNAGLSEEDEADMVAKIRELKDLADVLVQKASNNANEA